MKTVATVRNAFTLIELLIVVAIIAILAAIAVPNFLEAQTRAKVSRLVSDFRTIKVGLESYRVDTNKLPETDTGSNPGMGIYRLTSPIAYLTSAPGSPFKEDKIGSGTPEKFSKRFVFPLYVRAKTHVGTGADPDDGSGYSTSYKLDRLAYLYNVGGTSVPPLLTDATRAGDYMIKSVGPDNVDNRDSSQYLFGAAVYDPSNGTVSDGDVVTFGDTSINAANR